MFIDHSFSLLHKIQLYGYIKTFLHFIHGQVGSFQFLTIMTSVTMSILAYISCVKYMCMFMLGLYTGTVLYFLTFFATHFLFPLRTVP